MVRNMLLAWRHQHVFVAPERWSRDHAHHPALKACHLLTPAEAGTTLRDIEYRDPGFLLQLARELRYRVREPYDSRALLAELLRQTGRQPMRGDGPPSFATFFVARRRSVRTSQPPLDTWKEVREAVEAAERGPRGFVIVETVNEKGEPVAQVRCEVLLANGEVRSLYTDGQGKAGLDPIPQGRVHIRLPELDGAAWWPAEGASSNAVDRGRKSAHVLRQGECLARLAHAHGLTGWKKLWAADENKALRDKRKLASLVRAGDEVAIPARKVHEILRPTDTTHRVVIGALALKKRAQWST